MSKQKRKPFDADPAAWGTGTQCIQAGYVPTVGGPRVLPIFQSTTYKYEDVDQVERLFALKEAGYKYTRTGNPTVAGFEQKIMLLEGGVGAVAFASGQAATLTAVVNLCKGGDHLVSAATIYGGSYTLFNITLKKFGVDVTFVDPEAPAKEIAKAFRPNTRLLFAETIGNPALGILDFDKFASLARANNVPLIIDNTLATPYLCTPFKHGANIVVHSATKYIDGHATSLGGVVIDGGNFDWTSGKYPELTEPDPSYHGVRYVETFKAAAYAAKARAQYLRDFGACLSPFNGFMLNHGLETLHLRMEQHSRNALALATFLQNHPLVNWVVYPGLKSHSSYKRIRKYFRHSGASGVLTFGLKGDAQSIRKFVKGLRIAALVVHVGDARTGVLHPATSTHSQMTLEQQLESGITPDMIRVSVGIEDPDDIIGDFDQALNATLGGAVKPERGSRQTSQPQAVQRSLSVQDEHDMETVAVDAKRYLSLTKVPQRIKRRLQITLSSHTYLPQVDDLTSDWVAHVAVPAFKLIRSRNAGPVKSFCSIGAGSGLDVLAAIETLGATHVGLTDVHEDVVATAVDNIRKNTVAGDKLRIDSGFGDLLAPLRSSHARYDIIYENLPNVPLSDSKRIGLARASSAFLSPRKEDIPKLITIQLLDLHYLALRQAADFLKPGGAVLSILGSRVPLEVLLSLGKTAGYQTSFQIFTWKVQADPEEIVRHHARKQKQGYGPFYFYRADVLNKVFAAVDVQDSGERALDIERALLPERLDALTALAALKKGEKIGHTVAVLRSERG